MLHLLRELWRYAPRHPYLWMTGGALTAFILLHQFVVGSAVVRGESMAPTLDPGQLCLLNKCALLWRTPQRGELVAFRLTGDPAVCVKRVIGLPGEKLMLDDAGVFVNQAGLVEPYLPPHVITRRDKLAGGRLTVPPGQYFVLGDNRGVSEDSRSYGFVRQEELRGLVLTLDSASGAVPGAHAPVVHRSHDFLRVAQAFAR